MAENVNLFDGIKEMLKTYYKDGVENLLFRNSPVVKEITKERVEGKEQAFSAMIGRGGAVGGNFQKASDAAADTAKAAEFKVTPGQIFSVYAMGAKEVQASKSNAGAYMKVAGAKMFAATEAFRKTLAAAFYGRGYGELCQLGITSAITSKKAYPVKMPSHAIMAIDIGTKLEVFDKVGGTLQGLFTVQAIAGDTVTLIPEFTQASPKANWVLCLNGSSEEGKALLPKGLGAWLPTVGKRTGDAWTAYLKDADANFSVEKERANNPDRLCGAFYDGAKDDKMSKSVKALMQKVRRAGSQADLIIMNDDDFLEFSNEIESTNTFFTQTSTAAKKNATVGFDKFAASFSTNYIENIYDDPYCPKGIFYILDKEYVKLYTMTNAAAADDGVAGNEAGKADVMEANNDGHEDSRDGLIIDDFLNIQPGEKNIDGPCVNVALLFYGTFVVTNPSVCGVGLFKGAKVIEDNVAA